MIASAPEVADAGDADPLPVLVRLFLCGLDVRAERAEFALPGVLVGELIDSGVLSASGGRVSSHVGLVPWRGLMVAGDAFGGADKAHVDAASNSSLVLAELLIAGHGPSTAFDMGTGSGLLALLLARRGASVLATDVNPRAVAWADTNVALNAGAGITTQVGNWLEPAEGRRFDVVVANLPFVISPDRTLLYRDGGLTGDELARRVIRDAPSHLTDGGFAYLLCSWLHQVDEAWDEPLRRWIAGTGCDGVLLHHQSQGPAEYARAWNPASGRDPRDVEATLARWLAHYEEMGIQRVATGGVVLRRREGGGNWIHALEFPLPASGSADGQMAQIFNGCDLEAAHPRVDELTGLRLELAGGTALSQLVRWRDGSYQTDWPVLLPDTGIAFRVAIHPDVVHVLFRLGGGRSLAEAIAIAAEETGLDPDALSARTPEDARRLLVHGLLTVADRRTT